MSAPNLQLIFAPRARRDYENILLYTLREWGEDQEAVYAAALDRAFVAIGNYPQLGRERNDLRLGYRTYLVEQHVIYYRLTDVMFRLSAGSTAHGTGVAAPVGARVQAGWRGQAAWRRAAPPGLRALRRTARRGAGRTTVPGARPGAFPRGRGGRVGVPTASIIRGIARRTCCGVTGRAAHSQGRCAMAASGRARVS